MYVVVRKYPGRWSIGPTEPDRVNGLSRLQRHPHFFGDPVALVGVAADEHYGPRRTGHGGGYRRSDSAPIGRIPAPEQVLYPKVQAVITRVDCPPFNSRHNVPVILPEAEEAYVRQPVPPSVRPCATPGSTSTVLSPDKDHVSLLANRRQQSFCRINALVSLYIRNRVDPEPPLEPRPLHFLKRPVLRRHLHLGPVQLRDGGYLDLSETR